MRSIRSRSLRRGDGRREKQRGERVLRIRGGGKRAPIWGTFVGKKGKRKVIEGEKKGGYDQRKTDYLYGRRHRDFRKKKTKNSRYQRDGRAKGPSPGTLSWSLGLNCWSKKGAFHGKKATETKDWEPSSSGTSEKKEKSNQRLRL